jgi:trk system potassium uptake protein TrkA
VAIIKGTVKKKEYYIVIIGCGRLGSRIASLLSSQGHSVVVVDRDEDALQALSYEFSGFTILGEATELDTLKNAKLDKADIALVLSPDDNTNIMIALVAKEYFSTPRVIARAYDPSNLEVFSQFGIEIICPTLLAVESIKEALEIAGDES